MEVKKLPILLAMLLLASLLLPTHAAENMDWTLENGILTISGQGPMQDFSTASAISMTTSPLHIRDATAALIAMR